MKLILVRHGNTFEQGEPSRWVGLHEDLPLTSRGREQAVAVGRALRETGVRPAAIYAGPLQRTRLTAELIAEELGRVPCAVEPKLAELDYGDWGGLTDGDIRARFGGAALEDWSQRGLFPAAGRWGGTADEICHEVRAVFSQWVRTHAGDDVVAVSSNGRLRFFLKLIAGEWERRSAARTLSVRTGHIGRIDHRAHSMELAYWNVNPAELPAAESGRR